MIGELLLYGAAALLAVHVALDLRNVWHAMHRLRAGEEGPQFCRRCYSPTKPPGRRAVAVGWAVVTLVVLLAHLATDLIGDIP